MAITEGTQPAAVTWTNAWTTPGKTTASFTPEAGALLVALGSGDGSAAGCTGSMTDSLGGSWTLRKRQNANVGTVNGTCEVWIRDSPGTSLTVTWTNTANGANGGQLVVRTLLGALPAASQTGATNGTTVDPAAVQVSVTAGSGNKIYGAAFNFANSTAMTPLGNTSVINAFSDTTNGDTWEAFKSSADTAGTATYGYSTSTSGMIAAVEILAAPVGGDNPTIRNPLSQFPVVGQVFQVLETWQPPIPMQLWGWADEATGGVAQPLAAIGISGAEVLGAATVIPGGVTTAATGIPGAEAVGTAALTQTITAAGIPSAEASGQAAAGQGLVASGISSAEQSGQTTVTATATVTATGISSAEAVGAAQASLGAPQSLAATGIGGAERLGAITVTASATVAPSGISSVEAVGAVTATPGPVTLTVAGISSLAALGQAAAVRQLVLAGIGSLEQSGQSILTAFAPTAVPKAGQIEPGTRAFAGIEPGARAGAGIEPGTRGAAAIAGASKTSAQVEPGTRSGPNIEGGV